MRLWPKSLYHELLDKHNRAAHLFSIEDFHRLYEETSLALQDVKGLDGWSLIPKRDRQLLVANLIFFHARALEKIEPSSTGNAWKIVHLYERALTLLASNRQNPTFFSCCLAITDVCIWHAYSCPQEFVMCAIKYATLARTTVPPTNEHQYAVATRKIGDAHAVAPLGKENIEQAIRLYREALKLFKEQDLHDEVFATTARLSHTFLNSFLRDDPTNVEQAISYASSSLNNEKVDISRTDFGRLYSDIAYAYSIREYGVSDMNTVIAVQLFQYALEDLRDDPQVRDVWVVTAFRFINFLLKRSPVHRIDLRSFLDEIFSRIERNTDPEFWYYGLKIKKAMDRLGKVNFNAEKDNFRNELNKLLCYIRKETHPELWLEIQLFIADEFNLQDVLLIPSAIATYKAILHEAEILQVSGLHELHVDLGIRIARCYCRIDRWIEADSHFSSSIERLNGVSTKNTVFHEMNESLREAPIAAIHCNDIGRALEYSDYVYCKSIAFDLENLAQIDAQINRHSLFRRYIRVKLVQRVLLLEEDESKRLGILRQMKQYMNDLDDALGTCKAVGGRSEFYSNLDNYLPKLDSWVLIPILGERNSRLILIPPRAHLKDIYISKELDINYVSETYILARDYDDGWFATINRLRGIASLKDYPVELKEELGKIGKDFAEMEDHLWENYCKWVLTILQEHSATEPVRLCIVATGPLFFFPFSIAMDSYSEKQLIDFAEISYAPSLYSFYSLHERAKRYPDSPSLGFITGTDDRNLSSLDAERALVSKCFSKERQQHLSKNPELFKQAAALFGSTDHWHIATHARFGWGEPGGTNIDFGVKPLTADLLIGLAPEKYLRLATINGCESAMHNHLNSNSDPEGFLYQLLKIGAIGAVGSLWTMADASAAILMGRFYHHYCIEHLAPPAALRLAQCWVRDITKQELIEYVHSEFVGEEEMHSAALLKDLEDYEPDDQPFLPSIYWGGYILLGQ
jgi:CHAT domain-containing protein